MSLASISIRRPTFITSLIIVLVVAGYLLMSSLGVDQFPNVVFPVVTVTTPYPGAGPTEIETLVSKVLEDEVSGLSGLKTIRSINKEGVSILVSEFTLETDVKYAEQQIRDRVSAARRKLPTDIKDPIIRRLDPGDLPIASLAVEADLPEAQLYDVADQVIRPRLEQVPQVGLVEVLGGRKREVHVELDRALLKERDLSASAVAERLQAAGQNIPAGKVERNGGETVFRTLGEFKSVADIEKTVVNFLGNDVPVRVKDVGHVVDALEDENSRVFINGKKTLVLQVFRQSGANTIAVVDAMKKRLDAISPEIAEMPGHPRITLARNGTNAIHANVDDVKESIFIGIGLTVLVVFFFLGSVRSTIITGLSLPTSLLGAFILMALCGFTINIMTLLALSLAVGLLIDDAIVVRENIFRHQQELGKDRFAAALEGTHEVTLAVVATTLTVIAVFGPIAFLKGMVGQFFREFGLTICFAMLISLFDALTIAPMMSAYFAGKAIEPGAAGRHSHGPKPASERRGFSERIQGWIEDRYVSVLGFSVRRPGIVLLTAVAIFLASVFGTAYVPKTFLPAQDMGEFAISLDLPSGTAISKMSEVAQSVDARLRAHPEVVNSLLTVGNRDLEANKADFYVTLVPRGKRRVNTSEFKELIRTELKRDFAFANPAVTDYDPFSSGMRPFAIDVIGDDDAVLQPYAKKLYAWLKTHPALTDVDTSFRPGKPEVQVRLDDERAKLLGVSVPMVGMELRTQVEGTTPAVFRERGREYDIRVRLREDQRNLSEGFSRTYVPNINRTLVRLADIARPVQVQGPANINREDRGRYVQLMGDVAPHGPGLGGVLDDLDRMTKGELKPPAGVRLKAVGQAENFQEMKGNMAMAMGLGVLFIYLVLASLYESWVTPFTIMLVLPLAACGAFFGLLITQKSLDIYSMIGMVLLLGIATKNSILLVDYVNMKVAEGMDRGEAIIEAGRTRLRPILMTSFALIAGMLPVAIGLNEASAQRTSMGIAVIGGLISSTLLTLVVIPAAYAYVDRFRLWSGRTIARWMGHEA